MAIQDYIPNYTKISYTNIGDLVWRLRFNTNLNLSVDIDEAGTIYSDQHILLLTGSAEGTVVRGRIPSDPAGRSYSPADYNISKFVKLNADNNFSVEQFIEQGIDIQGIGYAVEGKNTQAITIANNLSYVLNRHVISEAKELYTFVSDNPTVGGQFIVDIKSSFVTGINLLPDVDTAAVTPAGKLGLVVTNATADSSYLTLYNLTGSDITILISKET